MGWYITEADINKDIKVSDLFHLSTTKVQLKHLDHLFRIYIKSMGKDTVCRVEESKRPKKPAIEFINDVFNPAERFDMVDKIGCECKGEEMRQEGEFCPTCRLMIKVQNSHSKTSPELSGIFREGS